MILRNSRRNFLVYKQGRNHKFISGGICSPSPFLPFLFPPYFPPFPLFSHLEVAPRIKLSNVSAVSSSSGVEERHLTEPRSQTNFCKYRPASVKQETHQEMR